MKYIGCGDEYPTYKFSNRDINVTYDVAKRITENKEKFNSTRSFGGRNLLETRHEAILSEYAVHEHFGLPYSVKISKSSGDKGHDMIFNGKSYQIKSTPRISDPFLKEVITTATKYTSDIYILVQILTHEKIAKLLGWTTKDEFIKEENKRRVINKSNYPVNYILRVPEMHRFGEEAKEVEEYENQSGSK